MRVIVLAPTGVASLRAVVVQGIVDAGRASHNPSTCRTRAQTGKLPPAQPPKGRGIADQFSAAYTKLGGTVVRRALNPGADPASVIAPLSAPSGAPAAVFFGGFTETGAPGLRAAMVAEGHGAAVRELGWHPGWVRRRPGLVHPARGASSSRLVLLARHDRPAEGQLRGAVSRQVRHRSGRVRCSGMHARRSSSTRCARSERPVRAPTGFERRSAHTRSTRATATRRSSARSASTRTATRSSSASRSTRSPCPRPMARATGSSTSSRTTVRRRRDSPGRDPRALELRTG